MNVKLVTAARAVARDLIEKRLWPVAALLLVALVAVPVLIGSGGDDSAPAPVAAAAPAAGADSGTSLTISDAAVLGRARPGKVRDPFFDPPKPAAQSAAGSNGITTAVPQPAAPAATAPSPSQTATASPPATTTTPVAPQSGGAQPSSSATVYRARVRWGADRTADISGLSRLEALGGLKDPGVLYLGTNVTGTRAAFLLGPNAIADGDGECAEVTCRVISLKPGESVDIGIVGLDGAPSRSFTLVLDEIAAEHVSAATAAERRGRVHPDGRDVLREMIRDPKTAKGIGRFAYDAQLGGVVLVATAP